MRLPAACYVTASPNFKLHKPIIDRRIRVMEEEGIHFKMNNDVDVRQLPEGLTPTASCTGAPTARDLPVPGRELKGIHPALDMLAQQNSYPCRLTFPKEQLVTAKGKKYWSSAEGIPAATA